ncbi:hypothetical protein [Thysanoplusia orichalcea nucleopolyhedrovirus]|uniref:Uncharacterized protein n=1 Tax=Thysanoplusia orichalcea nucleopolyhedrovirus TaxID=101850 RepID=L0CLA2_9ABAC|nr:hypothetical protein [Thysanoplusia orichalcea nucleopolyhedrovirus]AGA16225.1 hypothetical protein [Thysanoplusia orichalcea nucleopolyhedrovirus]
MKINLCNIQFQSLINLLNLQATTMSLLNSNKIKASLILDENDPKKITVRLNNVPEEQTDADDSLIDFPLNTVQQNNDFIEAIKSFETLHIEPDIIKTEQTNASSDNNEKVIDADVQEYTVDGLKLKQKYVAYYKCLKILVDFLVMYVSKEVSMKEYEQVYTLGRQLYEVLRSIFVDEPFKLWLERNAHDFDENKDKILDNLQSELRAALNDKSRLKTCTFKNIVTDLLNTQLNCQHDCVDEYIKPNCIVDTYNCCNLIFKKQT